MPSGGSRVFVDSFDDALALFRLALQDGYIAPGLGLTVEPQDVGMVISDD